VYFCELVKECMRFLRTIIRKARILDLSRHLLTNIILRDKTYNGKYPDPRPYRVPGSSQSTGQADIEVSAARITKWMRSLEHSVP